MSRNTSVVLGSHFERFIAKQLKTGRFESKSEVVRAGMRLLEERERKAAALRRAIVEGEESGPSVPFSIDEIIAEAQGDADQSVPPSSDV
jgi:antitoxin ParD1/3/4